jgi:hypothetical protein
MFARFASKSIAPLALIAMLSACGTSGGSPIPADDLQSIFQNACAGVSIADGAFKAVSPALLVSGTLTQSDLDKEQATFAVAQTTCATPPADLQTAAIDLLGDASAIYLLLARD